MVAKLFSEQAPDGDASVLDPGCGNGEFVDGILRACTKHGWPVPRIVGIELDPLRAATATRRFGEVSQIEIRHADFLQPLSESFDYIVGNPPYVSIVGLSVNERTSYRAMYRTASGRFDLYVLFMEQALRLLTRNGRLVFITPEKFLYVESARPLRELLQRHHIEELHFVSEETFGDRVTYPLVTTLNNALPHTGTRIVRRNGVTSRTRLSASASWMPSIEGFAGTPSRRSSCLSDVSLRISCGVATGADGVYVLPWEELTEDLRPFAHCTISGRQITPARELLLRSCLLAPYGPDGTLLPESMLGALGRYLRHPERIQRLRARTCAVRKPWYAFHDNFPLGDMMRPKLLCKDITQDPFFVVDREGTIVPRHSTYYVVPHKVETLDSLAEYLNGEYARSWLRAHCQRAANGFYRMQSHVLKHMPVPASFQPANEPVPLVPEHQLLPA